MNKFSLFILCLLLNACSSTRTDNAPIVDRVNSDQDSQYITQPSLAEALALKGDDSDIYNDADKVDPAFNRGLSLPVYGEWCGLNHPVDIDSALAPVDKLDRVCQTHDLCYVDEGDFNCQCDKNFTDNINELIVKNELDDAQLAYAFSFRSYFNRSLCEGDNSHKSQPTRVVQDVIDQVKDKRNEILNKIPFIN
jgi:hypothetical protein